MNCGDCSGKGCCSTENLDVVTVEMKHDTLFIPFKVFPLTNNITIFTLHR